MKVNPRVLLRKLADQFGFMRREIIENDVDFLLGRARLNNLFQEGDELFTGVARLLSAGKSHRRSSQALVETCLEQNLGKQQTLCCASVNYAGISVRVSERI